MDDIAEQIMMENRVPSTRYGWVIKVGMKVMGVFDNKVSTVTEIDEYKDGGFIILTDAQVENYDDDDDDCEAVVYSDEELFHHDDNSAPEFWERSSFCEVCFIHFNTEFVEWSHENRNYSSVQFIFTPKHRAHHSGRLSALSHGSNARRQTRVQRCSPWASVADDDHASPPLLDARSMH